MSPALCLSDAEGKWKQLLYLFPLLAKRVLVGREGESCSFLFGEGDSVGLCHYRKKPGVFRAGMKVRDTLTLSLSKKGNCVP